MLKAKHAGAPTLCFFLVKAVDLHILSTPTSHHFGPLRDVTTSKRSKLISACTHKIMNNERISTNVSCSSPLPLDDTHCHMHMGGSASTDTPRVRAEYTCGSTLASMPRSRIILRNSGWYHCPQPWTSSQRCGIFRFMLGVCMPEWVCERVRVRASTWKIDWERVNEWVNMNGLIIRGEREKR